ncbi:MAG: MFS transporter [Solirubrobacteraceae bacterium]|nr:MFS transporter [Solirubrobacteraceae bacterium]
MTERREQSAQERSGWAPMRFSGFRALWLAQFTSNVGSWMQTVAAQWLMVSLTSSTVLLSAIPAAASLPVLLLAVPAGVLGDIVDRRRLIFGAQLAMLLAAVALGVFAAAGWLTPWLLLALLFAIGCGGALSAPTWQTLQPELVPPENRSQAIALGSVNQNLARAVGPAIGGALLAATSASIVFAANAASFLAVLAAVALITVPPRIAASQPREHAVAAARAGGRFVLNAPDLLALLMRSVAFVFFAGAIWALLPLVARGQLGLGSAGYGGLLACVGVGAIGAATYGPVIKRRFAGRVIYAASCLVIGVAAVVLGTTTEVAVAVVALVAAGAAWIMGIGLLGAAYQGSMPGWVKARGISYYLIAFQGSNAIGALVVGSIAQASSVKTAFAVIGGALAIAAVVTWRLPLPTGDHAAMPAEPLPLPDIDTDPREGPVVVTVRYRLAAGNADAFLAETRALRRSRRRTGASSWRLTRSAEEPELFTEEFVVGSWEEHERQHARLEATDAALLGRLDALLAPGEVRTARHAFGVQPPR